MTRRELLTLWKSRDRRYTLRKQNVTPDEVALIHYWRSEDIKRLESEDDRDIAAAVLSSWRPPLVEVR